MGQTVSSTEALSVDELFSKVNVRDHLKEYRETDFTKNLKITNGETFTSTLQLLREKKAEREKQINDDLVDKALQNNIKFEDDEILSDDDDDADYEQGNETRFKLHKEQVIKDLKSEEEAKLAQAESHPIFIKGQCLIGETVEVKDHSRYTNLFPITTIKWCIGDYHLDQYAFSNAVVYNSVKLLITENYFGYYIRCSATRIVQVEVSKEAEYSGKIINVFNLNHKIIKDIPVTSHYVIGPVSVHPSYLLRPVIEKKVFKLLNITFVNIQQLKKLQIQFETDKESYNIDILKQNKYFECTLSVYSGWVVLSKMFNDVVRKDSNFKWLKKYETADAIEIPLNICRFTYVFRNLILLSITTDSSESRSPLIFISPFLDWLHLVITQVPSASKDEDPIKGVFDLINKTPTLLLRENVFDNF